MEIYNDRLKSEDRELEAQRSEIMRNKIKAAQNRLRNGRK